MLYIRALKPFLSKDYWEDEAESIWEYEEYFDNIEIEGISVSSEVSDQPVNEEIFKGAKNRVKNLRKYAKENNIDADFYIASEAGITNLLGDWIDINSAVIESREGLQSVGTSQGFPIPEKYVDEIIETELGKVMDKILNEQRVIVSNIPGTTRDAIDSEFENEFGKYTFIDTAGVRRKSKVNESIEKFSVMRTLFAIERADVCLVLIDATEGVTDQDAKILGEAHEAGKGIIIVVNKWEEVEKETGTLERYKKEVYEQISYASYAPVIFISAKTGQRLDRLFELIKFVYEQNNMRISTGKLNDLLADATARVQPPTDKGRRLKIYYMTQTGIKPPTFVIFCNSAELFHYSYLRYIENQIRATFGLEGTPIKFIIRERGKDQ